MNSPLTFPQEVGHSFTTDTVDDLVVILTAPRVVGDFVSVQEWAGPILVSLTDQFVQILREPSDLHLELRDGGLEKGHLSPCRLALCIAGYANRLDDDY